nr:MAG TPA: hypothetical protein [Caudoviricetes sp.]DAK53461.1 MAG TPA: hypothetical protein [Bacteriophage sp.]
MSILFFIYYNIIMFLFVPYTLCTTKVLILCLIFVYYCVLYLCLISVIVISTNK